MNEAIELLENMKQNMETVQTISVPYHVNQIKAAIAEIQALQAELDKYGDHTELCSIRIGASDICTCGWLK